MGGSGLWLRWTTLIAALAAPFAAGAGKPTVAFYYGRSLPVPELSHFGWVVVQPDHVEPAELEGLQRAGVRVFAYLSLGEAASDQVDPAWVLGSNPGWNSAIVNPAASG